MYVWHGMKSSSIRGRYDLELRLASILKKGTGSNVPERV
jgi:hypothetical protein